MSPTPSAAAEAWALAHEGEALERIAAFCRIPSVSTDPAFAGGIVDAVAFAADLLREAGLATVEVLETGGHPAILGEWVHDPALPTVLIYGHYDVQPPDPLGLWQSPPFKPELRDGRLYARGASDDKGPLTLALWAVRAFRETAGRPPVNLRVLVEGEEETGSPHLDATVGRLGDRLACDVVLSADGAMWRADLPSVTVASRGLVALEVTVTGAAKDLHSGRHGGSAPNAARALVAMLATLHDAGGRVAVPGFAAGVQPPDPEILEATREADFDPGAYLDSIGAPRPDLLPSGESLLVRQWLEPTIEINGLSAGYAGEGTKTVIPACASAKLTARLVAGQDPGRAADAVEAHLRRVLAPGHHLAVARHGPGTPAFAVDPALPALAQAEEVLEEVLGRRPLRVAMGATVPVGEVFARRLGAGTVFFSFSTSDEDYHAPNEFFRMSSLRAGLAAWVRLLARIGGAGR